MIGHTQLMMVGAAMPGLMIAGFIAVCLPLAVILIIRRRSKQLQWGAMWLVQETLRRRAPVRLLRVVLLLIRSVVLPLVAMALLGFNFAGQQKQPQHSIIILDDTIGVWHTDNQDTLIFSNHLEALRQLQEASTNELHVVLLSGRPWPTTNIEALSGLEPTSVGPDWTQALHRAQHLAQTLNQHQIRIVGHLRAGTTQDLRTPINNNVVVRYTTAPNTPQHIRITGVGVPRAILLPGDPLLQSQLTTHLDRSTADTQDDTIIVIEAVDAEGVRTSDQHHTTHQWSKGDHTADVSIPLPNDGSSTGVWHIYIEHNTDPAAQWWVRIEQPRSAEVTMITARREHPFNPEASASWLVAAVEAGVENKQLPVRWLGYQDIAVDALDSNRPLIITSPHRLSPTTWSTIGISRDHAATLIVPPMNASASWLDHTLTGVFNIDTPPQLPIIQPPQPTTPPDIVAESGPLSMLSSELHSLLRDLDIERLVDLRPLIDQGLGRSIVTFGGQPLFVQLDESNMTVSALAWHPSWSDLPIRSAAPAVLHELLRSDIGSTRVTHIQATAPDNLIAGVRKDGMLVQPNFAAADQRPMTASTLQKLKASRWEATDGQPRTQPLQNQSATAAIVVLALLVLELCVGYRINRLRVWRGAVS